MRDDVNPRLQTMLTDNDVVGSAARVNFERDQLLVRNRPRPTHSFLPEDVDEELLRAIEEELLKNPTLDEIDLSSNRAEAEERREKSPEEVDEAVMRAIELELLGEYADFERDDFRAHDDAGDRIDESFLDEFDADMARNSSNDAGAWPRLAFDRDNVSDQNRYGVTDNDSDRAAPNIITEIATWRQLATERNDPNAQVNLGLMYAKGSGVPQDFALAHMWFNLAAAAGDEDAISNRDYVAERMSPDQITEAQRMARDWVPRPARRANLRLTEPRRFRNAG